MTTDINQNFLSPIEFRFVIKRLPHVEYFVQSANVPGISASPESTPTPFKNLYRHGDKLEYDTFNVTVRVDENMKNFLEIYDWMVGLTSPESFDQYTNLTQGDGIYSDATLTILSNSKNPNIEITMKDIFPISLGSIQLSTTDADVNYATVDITFQNNGYSIKTI
jgi:hypothetical protein